MSENQEQDQEQEGQERVENCSICMEPCDSTHPHTQLECGHSFHTQCIIAWLRTPDNMGTCPNCRGEPGFHFRRQTLDERANTLVRMCINKRDVPKRLKVLLKRKKKADSNKKKARKAFSDLKRRDDVKKIMKELSKARHQRWRTEIKARSAKRELGWFHDSQFPLLAPSLTSDSSY